MPAKPARERMLSGSPTTTSEASGVVDTTCSSSVCAARMAIGMRASGYVPEASRHSTSPNCQPGSAYRVSTVMVNPTVPPAASSRVAVSSEPVMSGLVKLTLPFQVTASAAWLVALRWNEQSSTQPGLAADALSKVIAVFAAALMSRRPLPRSNGVAGSTALSERTSGLADVISMDLSSNALSSGYSCRRSAAAPATCGEAMLVPLMALYGPSGGGKAERMSVPGAATSGFRNDVSPFGPRELLAAMMSTCAGTLIVLVSEIWPVPTPPLASSASRIRTPSSSRIDTLGSVAPGIDMRMVPGWLFHRIMAMPPAAWMLLALVVNAHAPRETRAMWPSREPAGSGSQASSFPGLLTVKTGISGPLMGAVIAKSPFPGWPMMPSTPAASTTLPKTRPVCVFATARPDSTHAGQPIVLAPGPELPADVTISTPAASAAAKIAA